jgi:hypothetical protein
VTIPLERYRAMVQARRFFMELSNSSGFYKRTPASVREMARMLLKHFPQEWELEQLAKKSPDLLEK